MLIEYLYYHQRCNLVISLKYYVRSPLCKFRVCDPHEVNYWKSLSRFTIFYVSYSDLYNVYKMQIFICIKVDPHVYFMMLQRINLFRLYYVVLGIALNLAFV